MKEEKNKKENLEEIEIEVPIVGEQKKNKRENKKQIKKQKKEQKKEKKKKSKVRKVIKWILLILLIAVVAYGCYFGYRVYKNGGGLSGFLATAVGHDENTLKDLDRINVLILGESGVGDGYKLTDSIMIASYNPKTQEAALLSIPRDTYVGKRNKNTASQNYLASYKMNAVYRNGTNIPETIECVSSLTGLDLQYYLLVDTDAVIELVDAIGGVTFNVPIDMDYDDPTQDLHIHLKAGEQLIDGEKAEQLLRFRHNNDGTSYPDEYGDNDIGRMRTQREFIQETMKQLLKVENIFKITELIDIVSNNVKTNLDFNVLKDYVPYAVNFNTENLKTGTLPGVSEKCNGVWIYTADEEKTEIMVEDLFSDEEIIPEEEVANVIGGNTVTGKNGTKNITIELLNGSGVTTNLTRAAEKLQEAGFQVKKTGKSSTTMSKTTIINRTNQTESVEKEIKTELGVGSIQEGENNANVDFTIIIGKDYK